jgi:hypothetical protein
MPSEYDSLFSSRPVAPEAAEAFEQVRERFRAAGRPYLSSPWSWCAWGVLLPAAALATPAVAGRFGFPGVAILWSVAILAAGAVEARAMLEAGAGGSPLASWALHQQGNLSLVALALSVLLVVRDEAWALPGLWLLLLGHSFYGLGGLSFPALRRYGLAYQAGGAAALAAGSRSLAVFALATALSNFGLAWAVWRRRREGSSAT